jgi:uncharacterized protein (DUF1330 family)
MMDGMSYYCVAEMTITDPSWIESYVANVTAMVERHGGRYLARTRKIERLEGTRPAPQISFFIVAGEDVARAARSR